MWVAIIIAVLALLMVAFMPKPNIENARAAKLGDFNIPRAKWGDPVPLVWGRVRQKSPITLWFGDYNPVPIKKKVKDGLFSSKRIIVGYKYYFGLDLLLAAGPGIRLRRIWSTNKEIWSGNLTTDSSITINLPDLFGGEEERGGLVGTMRFYTGSFDTAQNGYLQSVLDPDVPAYNGKARAVFEAFYFGTTTSVGALSFELENHPQDLMPSTAVMPNGADVNPFEICYDALLSRWAKFGNDVQDIDVESWQACAQTVHDEGLGASMLLQSAITGKDFLEEIMRHVDGLLYQDPATSKIIAKLIRKDYDEASLIVLDESVVGSISNLSKTTWENTFNQSRVQFKDRANNYDESVALAQDFANINFQNRVKSTDISMPLCFVSDNANKLAARQLSFLNVPLFKCELICNRKAASLRPGSVFKLSWGPYGLQSMIMRVSKISLGTLTDNRVKITCVQDRYSDSLPIFAAPPPTDWTPITNNPNPVTVRKLMELPYWFSQFADIKPTAGQAMLSVSAKAPGSASVSFAVDMTLQSDPTFSNATRVLEDSPYLGTATLAHDYTSATGRASGYDNSVGGLTMANVDEPTLLYVNATLDRTGRMLMLVNDELMMAQAMTNNGDGTVTFKNIRRALLDTTFGSHLLGNRCYFIFQVDGALNVFASDTAEYRVRYIDRTPTATLDPAVATQDTIQLAQRAARPAPPDYLTIQGSRTPASVGTGTNVALAWRPRNRLLTDIRVYDDAADAAEAGTDYGWRWRLNGGAWSGYTYTSSTSAAMTLNNPGTYEFEVYSRRDGLLSRVGDSLSIDVTL